MSQLKQIALAFARGARQETFIEGVVRFASEAGREWSYLTPPESISLSVLHLKGWPGDGILAAINTPEEAAAASALTVPTVNVSSALMTPSIPSAIVDNAAVGRSAAEFLLTKGFRSFAFYGLHGVQYSKDRRAGFVSALEGRGFECATYLDEPTFGLKDLRWMEQNNALAEWLGGLTTPCGLMAVSDYRARLMLDASRRAGIRVPDELAVVGVDNEEITCTHARPPLSSVARNDELEGYRAAELLDRLMHGETDVESPPPITPLGVIARQSTASFAVSDPRLSMALTYLHDHLCDPITIDELTDHADVSRRWLEYAFREEFSETPYQYLRRQRLSLAKRCLINEPALHIYEVARRTGFTSAKQLATAFQQEFGVSPREYRERSGH